MKSGDSPTDQPSVDQLVGAMQHVEADYGLFLAWGGFKATVTRELAQKYFRLRLWDQKELIEQILAHYPDLHPEIHAELPLKRIWTVAGSDDESALVPHGRSAPAPSLLPSFPTHSARWSVRSSLGSGWDQRLIDGSMLTAATCGGCSPAVVASAST